MDKNYLLTLLLLQDFLSLTSLPANSSYLSDFFTDSWAMSSSISFSNCFTIDDDVFVVGFVVA